MALADLVRRGEISRRELTEAAAARAERVRGLNAIAAERFDDARNEPAPSGDGRLHGLPTFVKDNTVVAGLPTDHGSAALRSAPAKAHGAYGKQYASVGMVLLGKSALPEFGLNATTEPAHAEPTRNPWHLDYSTGASSGGSAALVASGVVPIAHANDGGGSIRIPAACCGLVGLKPSRGRHIVPESARSMPIDLISEGVVTRSVRDTATFHTEAERYYRNPKLPPLGWVEGPNARRLRIGLILDSLGNAETDAVTRWAVEDLAAGLDRAGHDVVPLPLPVADTFADDFLLYWAALAFALRVGGRFIVDSSFDASRLDGLTRGLSRHFSRRFHRLPGALRRLGASRAPYEQAFERVDVFLSPVLAHATPKIGHLSPTVDFEELRSRLRRYVGFTPLANVTGAPALSLPVARTPEGLPIAAHLSGRIGDERTLLELAYEIEADRPWPIVPGRAAGERSR